MHSFNDNRKQEIANVLFSVLNMDDVSEHIKKRVLNDMLWSATADLNRQDDYKYKGPIWSQEAIAFYPEWLNNGRRGLRHEHLLPKGILREFILNIFALNDPNILFNLLWRFSHAAVITRDEDRVLNQNGLRFNIPDGLNFNPNDNNYLNVLFARYSHVGINLKFVTFDDNQLIEQDSFYLENGNVNIDFINNHLFNYFF